MARGTSSGALVLRGVRVVLGATLAVLGLASLHGSVAMLTSHDYLGALLLSSVGLFLVASGTTLFRPEVAE